MVNKYREYLFSLQDEKYGDFTAKLVPTLEREKFIGVRLPEIRKYAKELVKTGDYIDFLNTLPHTYHEENVLHVCIVSLIKNYDEVIELTEKFLPYIDNWAVCDSFNPKCFAKNKDKLYLKTKEWLTSEHIYTRRFAIDMLMGHFLDEAFDAGQLSSVASAQGEDYYLKMVIAWYFATALAKQYDDTIPFLENKLLDKWTHNKTIQKAIESYRISDETKDYLRSLKIK